MTKEADRLLDDLRDLSEDEFAHVYEMPKRAACILFQVEPYTVGFLDGIAAQPRTVNSYVSALHRTHYETGYRDGARRRRTLIGSTP